MPTKAVKLILPNRIGAVAFLRQFFYNSKMIKPLEITGKDNPKIKFLRQLQRKKYRDKFGKFMVENAVIIGEALKAGIFFESIFLTRDFIDKNKERFDEICGRAKVQEYYLIDERINKSFSSLITAPGICAVYAK